MGGLDVEQSDSHQDSLREGGGSVGEDGPCLRDPLFRAVRHFVCRRGATAEREVPGSDRARPDASVSKWPCPSQVHRASPKPGRWPISPAAPWGPSYRSPAIHRAPPTPVPRALDIAGVVFVPVAV